jgi:hypothetical protein
MDTFETFQTPTIDTTSLHEIIHHELFSPHRHSPVFFAYNDHYDHNDNSNNSNSSNSSSNNIHNIQVYKKEKNEEERIVEMFITSSWS